MRHRNWLLLLSAACIIAALLPACYSYGPTDRLFTPVPTLIPVKDLSPLERAMSAAVVIRCPVRPVDLLGAWVGAGVPETDPFPFTSEEGQDCVATFQPDVQKVFTESNLWFVGAPACVSCHHADVQSAIQNMDLSSYAGILAGSQRTSDTETGKDILGGGNWENARLREMLVTRQMPPGRPGDSPERGPVIFAGVPAGE